MKNFSKKSRKEQKEIIELLKNFIRQNGSSYLQDNNISSIGIGYKIQRGKRTDELSLQFTVNEKVELDVLENIASKPIPDTLEVGGITIPTDVLERRYQLSYEIIEDISDNNRKTRVDPVFPGLSISHVSGTAGTAGCIVYDKENQTPYMLSNWHVLQGDNGTLYDNIVQPGPHDNNRVGLNRLGTLVRSHLGHAGDAAICTIENRGFTEEIYQLNTKVRRLSEPGLLDKVIKSGRTTGVTFGVVERIHVISRIYYGTNTGMQEIGCFEIGLDNNNIPANGEISMGGDSGSVWLIAQDNVATDIMAGLHFAGEAADNPHEHALACYPKGIFEKLGIVPSESEDIKQISSIGYNPNFLSNKVNVPILSDTTKAFLLEGCEVIDYTHFSLALHKERRFAIWVAWNIDGSQVKRISRSGVNFRYDKRIPNKYQIGNQLYRNNDLDRGHLAKRADLTWGTMEEAKNANKDSFFYTNIAPQMNNFNQSSRDGVWGNLENAIFAEVEIDHLKISLFGGPIFQEEDKIYRDIQIPQEFYKVILYEESGQLKSKAFLLTQNIVRLEILGLDEFKTYEISLNELEERGRFTFDSVLYDSQNNLQIEALQERRPITSLSQINW